MHVAERNRELERQREQRQIRPQSRTRPEPAHRRHASRVSCRGRTILPAHSRALLQCNNADNWAALRFLWRVAKNQHCEVQRAVPQPRLLKTNKKSPPTEAG